MFKELIRDMMCDVFGCKEVVTSQGYPANKNVWTIYSTCSRCEKNYVTEDDLFIGGRPSDFPLSQPFMTNPIPDPPPFGGKDDT